MAKPGEQQNVIVFDDFSRLEDLNKEMRQSVYEKLDNPSKSCFRLKTFLMTGIAQLTVRTSLLFSYFLIFNNQFLILIF